jgi:hypothetical protein
MGKLEKKNEVEIIRRLMANRNGKLVRSDLKRA